MVVNANRGTALQKKRAIRLLILVVIAFAILLLPIHIHLLVGLTVGPLERDYPWYEVSVKMTCDRRTDVK